MLTPEQVVPIMRAAIAACERGISAGQSPFGAAIGDEAGRVVVGVHNTVRADCDACAHAEINAIREACRRRGGIHLSGWAIASTCEPCPMCAAAIHWARLESVAFGASIADAARAGFNELPLPCGELLARSGSGVRIIAGVLSEDCRALFDRWRAGAAAQPY